MPFYHRTIFLGHDLAIFLPEPNWRWSLEIVHRLGDRIEAGGTGRENRTPKHLVIRHEFSATFTVDQTQTAELENALWELGTAYIALPIFVDQLEPARWSERIYDAEWVINYDETGYTLHPAASIPAVPTRRWLAPLLVGRRSERPKLVARLDTEAQYALKIVERSPWDFRIAPAAQAVGINWPAILEANWKQVPDDGTEDLLVYEDVGEGRVEAVDGQEGVTRRTQRFLVTCEGRVQIRTLLNFFYARKGRVQSFEAPWCLRAGEDTAATPWTTVARFAENALKLVYKTDETADAVIAMTQVPWEIAGVDGETPECAPEAYYYRISLDVPGGPVVWRFTNWEHDLERTEDAVLVSYKGDVAALFQHDRITQSIDLADEPTTIGSWIFAENPLVRVVQRTLDVPLVIQILRGSPLDPDAAVVVYDGEIAEVLTEGRKLSATTQLLGGLLQVKVPNFYFGPVCNYQFCGAGCTLSPDDWTFAGTIVGQIGRELTVTVTSNPPAAALVDDTFAKAWIKTGTGLDYQLRQVVRSVDLGAGQQRFVLKRPLRDVDAGSAIAFRPYCSGTRAECESTFGNYINFGGHPHIGAKNLSVPSLNVETPAGKK